MALEENPKARAAYILLPLAGFVLAGVSSVAARGEVNPWAPILFLGGVFAAVAVWIWRKPRRERLKDLSIVTLVAVLTLSLATFQEQAKPKPKRSPAGQTAGTVAELHTDFFRWLGSRFVKEEPPAEARADR